MSTKGKHKYGIDTGSRMDFFERNPGAAYAGPSPVSLRAGRVFPVAKENTWSGGKSAPASRDLYVMAGEDIKPGDVCYVRDGRMYKIPEYTGDGITRPVGGDHHE